MYGTERFVKPEWWCSVPARLLQHRCADEFRSGLRPYLRSTAAAALVSASRIAARPLSGHAASDGCILSSRREASWCRPSRRVREARRGCAMPESRRLHSLKANGVLDRVAVFERAPQLMPHERSSGCGERNVSGSWWRFPPQSSLVEPTLGLLNQLAKREMSSEPLHHLWLPLDEESREKLSSRLRTNELWELASHLVDLVADLVGRLLDGPVGPVPVSIRWHGNPSRSPRPKRYTFSRSIGAGVLGGAVRGPGGCASIIEKASVLWSGPIRSRCNGRLR